MIDFWVAVLLTAIVSVLTILADWLASKFIFAVRTLRSIRDILQAGLSSSEVRDRIKNELERYKSSRAGLLAWGTDLATVAISMDFVALGIWIHNSNMFPFFSRFNSEDIPREIPVWLIVICLHLILLFVSLIFKNNYAEITSSTTAEDIESFPKKAWFAQNGWMIAANSTGFFSLLIGILVFTNSI